MSAIYQDSQFEIIHAEMEYLEDIFKIAQMYSLSNLSTNHASESGFLVSDFSIDDYKQFIEDNRLFWILLEAGELRAFMLAIDPKKQVLDPGLNNKVQEFGLDEYLLIKQICIHPDHTSKGIASRIYKTFIKEHHDIPLVASIVTDPPNPISINFHNKMGFKLAFEYAAPDGLPREIWVYTKGG